MSAAAKKAWATRRHGKAPRTKPAKTIGRTVSDIGKQERVVQSKGKSRKRKGKGMPENVKEYFRNITKGMSKADARKAAGMPPKSKGRKKWGPGHPLYDWKQKQ